MLKSRASKQADKLLNEKRLKLEIIIVAQLATYKLLKQTYEHKLMLKMISW